MLAKFDPIIMDHVNRIQNKETHIHYLGHRIQDELINMMANEIYKKAKNNKKYTVSKVFYGYNGLYSGYWTQGATCYSIAYSAYG